MVNYDRKKNVTSINGRIQTLFWTEIAWVAYHDKRKDDGKSICDSINNLFLTEIERVANYGSKKIRGKVDW